MINSLNKKYLHTNQICADCFLKNYKSTPYVKKHPSQKNIKNEPINVCTKCSEYPYDIARLTYQNDKYYECFSRIYDKYSCIVKIPHTSDKTDNEKCNVENLKKMCTDFLYDDNTVEEIDQKSCFKRNIISYLHLR